mmetsp:Transcript_19519/g.39293  ORF Transcript_19519/g.39293 Transcript_19519/m.39293 type:complete len:217 (+) Transcript_19519:485-1135(+)
MPPFPSENKFPPPSCSLMHMCESTIPPASHSISGRQAVSLTKRRRNRCTQNVNDKYQPALSLSFASQTISSLLCAHRVCLISSPPEGIKHASGRSSKRTVRGHLLLHAACISRAAAGLLGGLGGGGGGSVAVGVAGVGVGVAVAGVGGVLAGALGGVGIGVVPGVGGVGGGSSSGGSCHGGGGSSSHGGGGNNGSSSGRRSGHCGKGRKLRVVVVD